MQLNKVLGCTPSDLCINCVPFNSPGSVFPLLSQALAEIVVNETRKAIPRYIFANTGGIRSNMHKGPFTYDDVFTIMPSRNSILYIPEMPCAKAESLLVTLNGEDIHREHEPPSYEFDLCVDPVVAPLETGNGFNHTHPFGAVVRRQVIDIVPGYTTTDDFGSDGDDSVHDQVPYYDLPQYYQGAAGFGNEGCTGVADVVFVDL